MPARLLEVERRRCPTSRGRRASSSPPCARRRRRRGPARRRPPRRRRARARRPPAPPPRAPAARSSTRCPGAGAACAAARPCRRARTSSRRASSTVSIVSRVVPGTSETITRSSPRSAFRSDDLPTFGRPRIATRIASSPTIALVPAGQPRDDVVEQVARPVAVERGERHRVAEPEAVELERLEVAARVVDLVREHDHGLRRGAQDRRELLVARRDARPARRRRRARGRPRRPPSAPARRCAGRTARCRPRRPRPCRSAGT